MAARREITKKYARAYASTSKLEKGRLLDELVGVSGWSRPNARRAIAAAGNRRGAARSVVRKPRAPIYGYDTRKVLIEVWTLIGEPCGKYLAPIMKESLAQLEAFGELAKVSDRLDEHVRAQLVAVSPATIDRMLRPTKAAGIRRRSPRPAPGARCGPRSGCARRWMRWSRLRGSSGSTWSRTADTPSRANTRGR